jgi:hypothetical protein
VLTRGNGRYHRRSSGGFDSRSSDRPPIECHPIATNRIPREIASFFCSALVNCSTIFGDLLEVSSFKLDERRIVRHHDTCRAVYAYLDSLGGRQIRLHEFQAADVGAGR